MYLIPRPAAVDFKVACCDKSLKEKIVAPHVNTLNFCHNFLVLCPATYFKNFFFYLFTNLSTGSSLLHKALIRKSGKTRIQINLLCKKNVTKS